MFALGTEVQTCALPICLRARLMPPAPAAVPGGYEFARLAWFKGIGATGRGFGEPRTLSPPSGGLWAWLDRIRGRLTAHVQTSVGDAEGGIAEIGRAHV